jgi:hypothetical protein
VGAAADVSEEEAVEVAIESDEVLLWFGTVGLAAFTSLLISFLVVPPSVPIGAWAPPPANA